MKPRLLATALAISLVSQADPAAAQEIEVPRDPNGVYWREQWPRFRIWEYVGTGALLAGSFGLRFGVDSGTEPNTTGGVLFDEAAFGYSFITDPQVYEGFRQAGDAFYFGSLAFSAAEPLIVGIAHDWDLAAQITLMNLEAFAVYSSILFVSQHVVRRERPTTRLCDDPIAGELGFSCSGNNTIRSFIGGHVGTVTTAATLTCLHHAHLPLWGAGVEGVGGRVIDALPCATWIGATAVVFASRTATGRHYVSDNLLGLAAGSLSGLVPYALHYAIDQTPDLGPVEGAIVAPIPTGGVTIQLTGRL